MPEPHSLSVKENISLKIYLLTNRLYLFVFLIEKKIVIGNFDRTLDLVPKAGFISRPGLGFTLSRGQAVFSMAGPPRYYTVKWSGEVHCMTNTVIT